MQQTLEQKVVVLLQKNQGKKTIYKTLLTDTNRHELINILNCQPTALRRKKTFIFTLFLIILLLMLTIKRCLFMYLQETSSVALLLGAIVPIIHIYNIRELIRGHRLAYQMLPILSVLALFRQENRIIPDMYMYATMAVLSGILYLYLFPKSQDIDFPAP